MNCCAAAGRRVFLQIFCPAVRNFSFWQPQVAQSCLYRARRIRYDGGEVRHMCRQDGRAADAARERDGCAPAEGAGRADAMDGELGARIRAQRVRCGLSQEQLAGQVGVSRQAVTKWETGRAAPGAAHLFRLAQALGTTVDLLLPRAGTGADGADAARAAQEAHIRARRTRWKRRGALALAVAGAYLLLYLAGRMADGDLSQRTVLEVLFGRDDPAAGGYLFGWLLSRRLLLASFAASVLPALLGAPRLSLAALAGCLLGLLLGEAFGPVPGGAALGHGHCGWAIWCGVSLLSLAFGALLERRCRRGMALRLRGFLLWCAAFLLCAALVCLLARLGAAPPAGH